jgi:glycosyltransferase involved in cell wall biosynthesis
MRNLVTDYISIIMPTFNQEEYISRAIASLQLQTHEYWELIIVNDGSDDRTSLVVSEYLSDSRIKYYENPKNEGLGYSLNKGISLANYNFIAYLPSDDIYFSTHLETLYAALIADHLASLVFSGVRHAYLDNALASSYQIAKGKIEDYPIQLVQVMHRKTNKKWLERSEFITDDLGVMLWNSLLNMGHFIQTNLVTCEWVDHPWQRHKIINEKFRGGIYFYKKHYNVTYPLKFQSTTGTYIDEENEFRRFRTTPPQATDKLKILLVGELAYNPERIFALEEQGHDLYGLWLDNPSCFNTIGPLPFGNVKNIPEENWIEHVKEVNPDIIYALLNHQAVHLAHFILFKNLGIPFVWHFKEGPFYSRQFGKWKKLIELYVNSDGQIYTNIETQNWFQQFIDKSEQYTMILDGDLPKKDWFGEAKTQKLSDVDGAIHTVVPGRPMGLTPQNVEELAKQNIHLHLYGDLQQTFWKKWIEETRLLAPDHIHLHPHCIAENWVAEFSQYDAGWLHFFASDNDGELMKASWLDLNYPARMPTLAAAGLPMIQKDNTGHIASTQSLIQGKNMGIFFNSFEELGAQLKNKDLIYKLSENVWNNRMFFTFDYHVKELVSFFRNVIERKKKNNKPLI